MREDLTDNDSDMDEKDVQAMFEVDAHEQHVDLLEDDSDLDAVILNLMVMVMVRTTKKILTRSKTISQTWMRTSLCFPPQCQLSSSRVSFRKTGGRIL